MTRQTNTALAVANKQDSTHSIAAQASAAKMLELLREVYPSVQTDALMTADFNESAFQAALTAQGSLGAYIDYVIAVINEADLTKKHCITEIERKNPNIAATITLIDYVLQSFYSEENKIRILIQLQSIAQTHPGARWNESESQWSQNTVYAQANGTYTVTASVAETLNLVAAALQDTDRFMSVDTTTDCKERLHLLCNTLLRLQKNTKASQRQTCSTRRQHELLFLLNHAYLDRPKSEEGATPVMMVKDVESFALGVLSEYIQTKLMVLGDAQQQALVAAWVLFDNPLPDATTGDEKHPFAVFLCESLQPQPVVASSAAAAPPPSDADNTMLAWQDYAVANLKQAYTRIGIDPNPREKTLRDLVDAVGSIELFDAPQWQSIKSAEMLLKMSVCDKKPLTDLIQKRNDALIYFQEIMRERLRAIADQKPVVPAEGIAPGAARVTDVLAATSSRTPAEDLAAGTGSGDSSAGTTEQKQDPVAALQNLSTMMSDFFKSNEACLHLTDCATFTVFFDKIETKIQTEFSETKNELCQLLLTYFQSSIDALLPTDFEYKKEKFLAAKEKLTTKLDVVFVTDCFSLLRTEGITFSDLSDRLTAKNALWLSDNTLKKWYQDHTWQNVLSLSAYEINRILLRALSYNLDSWTTAFRQALTLVVDWLLMPDKPTDPHTETQLKKSYTPQFLLNLRTTLYYLEMTAHQDQQNQDQPGKMLHDTQIYEFYYGAFCLLKNINTMNNAAQNNLKMVMTKINQTATVAQRIRYFLLQFNYIKKEKNPDFYNFLIDCILKELSQEGPDFHHQTVETGFLSLLALYPIVKHIEFYNDLIKRALNDPVATQSFGEPSKNGDTPLRAICIALGKNPQNEALIATVQALAKKDELSAAWGIERSHAETKGDTPLRAICIALVENSRNEALIATVRALAEKDKLSAAWGIEHSNASKTGSTPLRAICIALAKNPQNEALSATFQALSLKYSLTFLTQQLEEATFVCTLVRLEAVKLEERQQLEKTYGIAKLATLRVPALQDSLPVLKILLTKSKDSPQDEKDATFQQVQKICDAIAVFDTKQQVALQQAGVDLLALFKSRKAGETDLVFKIRMLDYAVLTINKQNSVRFVPFEGDIVEKNLIELGGLRNACAGIPIPEICRYTLFGWTLAANTTQNVSEAQRLPFSAQIS